VANFGQLSVPYVEDVQPLPEPDFDPGTFTFSQEQLDAWQPIFPDYAQSSEQHENLNPLALDLQPDQPQAHPHGHPHPVQAGPASPLQQPPLENPWQQVEQHYPSTQPPPPRQEQHWLDRPPGARSAQPSNSQPSNPQPSDPQPSNSRPGNSRTSNPRPRNPRPTNSRRSRNPRPRSPQPSSPQPSSPQQQQPPRVGVGYRFRPGLGFVCQECGTVMQQPNMHLIVDEYGQRRWCEAAGTELSEQVDIMEDVRRRRGGDVV
jgi:hypothetical protein